MNKRERTIPPCILMQYLFLVIVVPFLPLLISRRWGWWEAWVFAIFYISGFAVSRALAERHNPGLLAERARLFQHEDAKPGDKVLMPLGKLGLCLIPLGTASRAHRDVVVNPGHSSFPGCGLGVSAGGFFTIVWPSASARKTNHYRMNYRATVIMPVECV